MAAPERLSVMLTDWIVEYTPEAGEMTGAGVDA
jgi:hypothetical protein